MTTAAIGFGEGCWDEIVWTCQACTPRPTGRNPDPRSELAAAFTRQHDGHTVFMTNNPDDETEDCAVAEFIDTPRNLPGGQADDDRLVANDLDDDEASM